MMTLAELGAKINESFAAIKTSFEHFTVLEDAATGAIKARDEARSLIVHNLDDLQASITKMRESIADPAPIEPPAIT